MALVDYTVRKFCIQSVSAASCRGRLAEARHACRFIIGNLAPLPPPPHPTPPTQLSQGGRGGDGAGQGCGMLPTDLSLQGS